MNGDQVLLRFFMLSTDQVHGGVAGLWGVPAYEWVVQRARRRHGAGATVLRGMCGFGRRGWAPPPGWHVAEHVPVVVEIVDSPASIAGLCREEIFPHVAHGTITLERVGVMRYRHRDLQAEAAPLALLEQSGELSTLPTLPEIGGSVPMQTTDAILLRIFAGSSDVHEGRPLHEAILKKAQAIGLAGGTVFKGSMGFGAHSVLHTSKVMEFSTDLPMVIEFVDAEEKIRGLLAEIDPMVREGLVTMERVRVVRH
jgi:PII-like signaling protein